MKNLPKILVVLAIIAASLYFVHRLEQCSIAGVQPAPAPAPAPARPPLGQPPYLRPAPPRLSLCTRTPRPARL